MEYWLKSRISYYNTPILQHSSTPRLVDSQNPVTPGFALLLVMVPLYFERGGIYDTDC